MSVLERKDMTMAERDAERDAYIASLPGLLERLDRRLSRAGIDMRRLSLIDMPEITAWFADELRRDESMGEFPLPTWWDRDEPPKGGVDEEGVPRLNRHHFEIIDETAALLVERIFAARPDARWLFFKGPKRDYRNGNLVIGVGARPIFAGPSTISPRDLMWGVALGIVRRPPSPNFLGAPAKAIDQLLATPIEGEGK
ncbi:MAG: hypothetical protein J7484_15160 [Microbacterium sp.]|nr:hypothetical protein [Microbacterium sp.]